MHAVVNVLPKTSDIVLKQIGKIVLELARGVEKKEVELVKKPLLNQLAVLRQNNSYWLNSVMANSTNHPERLDWANNMVPGYSAITHDDLTLLAKQYLKMNEGAIIIIKPENH
jgi:zinc protease